MDVKKFKFNKNIFAGEQHVVAGTEVSVRFKSCNVR